MLHTKTDCVPQEVLQRSDDVGKADSSACRVRDEAEL